MITGKRRTKINIKPLQNKKAQAIAPEGILWWWRFILIGIFVGFIVLFVLAHFSKPYDARQIETALLAGKTIRCIKPDLYLNEKIFDDEKIKENIKICIPLSDKDIGETFINASLYDIQASPLGSTIFKKNFVVGNENLGPLCGSIFQGVEMAKGPSCSEHRYYAVNSTGSEFIIELVIGIQKLEF